MKAIRFILALYVLALAVYPCTDRETCFAEHEGTVVLAESVNHDHSTSEIDTCTPFCICSCCAAHVQFGTVTSVSSVNFAHNTEITTLYIEGCVLNNEHAIWQPPRLG